MRNFSVVMIGVHLRDYPAMQVLSLLTINLIHMIFILIVKPYDEHQKWLGNKAAMVNGTFVHLILLNLMSMMLAFAQINDLKKMLEAMR